MPEAATGDHRTRVGREKRERMRKRLLSAVMLCYADRKGHETPGIDDVIRIADVSRATFYLHFVSMEEAFKALSDQLADEIKSVEHFFERSDPLERLAIGIQMFLLHGVADRVWADFVSDTNYLSRDPFLIQAIESHLLEAREAKLVHFAEVKAARSLMLGSQTEALRLLNKENKRNRAYIEELTVMILCGLRADYERSKKAVHDTTIYIRGFAPDCVPWWRDPWT
jgi:AcrR family transcriptional regulator